MKSARAAAVVLTAILGLVSPLFSQVQAPELRVIRVQYENLVSERVTEVYSAGLAKLDASYLAGLERSLAEAKTAGDLEGALALEAEKKRVAGKQALPGNDEQASNAQKKLRGIYRAELAKLDAQRASNQAVLLTPYIAKLKQLESELTKADRLDEAKAVLGYRQGITAGVPIKADVPSTATPSAAGTRSAAPSARGKAVEFVTAEIKKERRGTSEGIALHGESRFSTEETFVAPVEITIVAKTDKHNLRLTYAADEIAFNWEDNPEQLRVEGGPAGGKHKQGAGGIPANQFVTIKWIVTPKSQTLFVDGKARYTHEGDYSQINKAVSVFSKEPSIVKLKSLKVRKMGATSQDPAVSGGKR